MLLNPQDNVGKSHSPGPGCRKCGLRLGVNAEVNFGVDWRSGGPARSRTDDGEAFGADDMAAPAPAALPDALQVDDVTRHKVFWVRQEEEHGHPLRSRVAGCRRGGSRGPGALGGGRAAAAERREESTPCPAEEK